MFFELWQRVNLRIINNPQGEMPSQFGGNPAAQWCHSGGRLPSRHHDAQIDNFTVTIVIAACATVLYGQSASSRAQTQRAVQLTKSHNIEPDGTKATLPRELLHELKQPLNVIRLATDNIRVRILPLLESDEAGYLAAKLDRIERQIYRAANLWDIGVDAGESLATAPRPLKDTPPA